MNHHFKYIRFPEPEIDEYSPEHLDPDMKIFNTNEDEKDTCETSEAVVEKKQADNNNAIY